MLDATTDESSSYNESVYNTPNITTKRKLSVKNRSFFSMIVVIAVLIFIFVIFLYTQLFGKRWVVANL